MPKITKRVVDALKPEAEREMMVWDSELRGFGIRVMPRRHDESPTVASYIVKYRNKEGRQRKLVLGRAGAITPEEARGLARQKLGEVAHGADPSAERSQLRKALTVAELCDLYMDDAKGRVKESTLSADRSRIKRHVKPLIGSRPVIALTPQDIAKMQADIAAGKTAAARQGRGGVTTGGRGAASRTVGMLGTILEFAVSRRVTKDNPARGVSRPADGRQQRFLSAEEIAKLGQALDAGPQADEPAVGLAAIRFLLLSGCRKMEALKLRTEWVDARARCIRYPDTKSGAQIRPIGSAATKVLMENPGRNGWAFPSGATRKHFVGLPRVLERLCKAAKLEGVTTHVLRHSFAATAAEMGFSELTIAGLLGHTVPGVTARYAHVPDRALVAAADQVSKRIALALEGHVGTEVVELRRGVDA